MSSSKVGRHLVISSHDAPVQGKKKTSFSLQKLFNVIRDTFNPGVRVGKTLMTVKYKPKEKANLATQKKEMEENRELESFQVPVSKKRGGDLKATKVKLDAVEIKPTCDSVKVIVFFLGMGDCYEKHLSSFKKLADDTHAKVVAFNYRGVGDSTGRPSAAKDLAEDGKAVIEHLKSEGVNPKNIMLYGHSLGGGIASEVYGSLEHKGPIITESSFSDFKSAVRTKRGGFAAWLLGKLNWNVKNLSHFEKIPMKMFGIVVNRRDPTVVYRTASLYKKMKQAKGDFKEILRVKIGAKAEREAAASARVETGKRKDSEKMVKTGLDVEYTKYMRRVKKAGLSSELRHPHQMVIDQNMDVKKEHEFSPRVQARLKKSKGESQKQLSLRMKDVELLNAKFAREDQQAYDGIKEMISQLFNQASAS